MPPTLTRSLLGGLAAASLVVALAACGDDVPGSGAASSTPPPNPTAGVTTPPTDQQTPDLVVGRIVRSTSGPCYAVESEDGTLYAVYSETAGRLERATTVTVKTTPRAPGRDCGDGVPVTAVRIDVVR